MRNVVKVGFVFALIAMLNVSCDKDKSYPETPELEFLRMEELPGDSIAMVVRFQDGDGDIGSRIEFPADGQNQCPTLDVLSRYYELEDGEWVYLPDFDAGWCIQSLTPEGQDKTLEGEIISRFGLPINLENPAPNSDSSRIGIRLKDRAEHISNEVFSPLIVIE